MSWRSAMRRTRNRPRNTLVNSENWGNSGSNAQQMSRDGSEQIGMHVRVLRYHEIRLGNIEKQLANLSRQLSGLGNSSTTTASKIQPKNKNFQKNKDETVTQLQGVLKNLAEEVASSNKMIKQFITGDNVTYKKEELQNKSVEKPKVEEKINEKDTLEWKLAKSRLVRCGIRATDERIRDMISTMKEEVDLVNNILENHTDSLEKSVEKAVEETIEIEDNQLEETKETEETEETENTHSEESDKEETIDISTSNDIGYVPVHVVVKKKRGRPKKKNKNAK